MRVFDHENYFMEQPFLIKGINIEAYRSQAARMERVEADII